MGQVHKLIRDEYRVDHYHDSIVSVLAGLVGGLFWPAAPVVIFVMWMKGTLGWSMPFTYPEKEK